MPTVEKMLLGSITSLITTGMNSLADGSLAISASFDNTIGSTGDGYLYADLELSVTWGTSPGANTGMSAWFLMSQDGTNYEDGGTSVTPARPPDVVFPARAVNTLQLIVRRALIPWGKFKVLIKNDGTGQALAASGNTLKMRPATPEGV